MSRIENLMIYHVVVANDTVFNSRAHENSFRRIFCTENASAFSCDPKFKTVKLLPYPKEYDFKFMDIIKN